MSGVHLLEAVLRGSRLLGTWPLDRGLRRAHAWLGTACLMSAGLLAATGGVVFLGMASNAITTERHRLVYMAKVALLGALPAVHLCRLLFCRRRLGAVQGLLVQVRESLIKAGMAVDYRSGRVLRIAILRLVFELVFEVTRVLTLPVGATERLFRCLFFFSGMVIAQLIQLQFYCFLHIFSSLMSFLEPLVQRPFVIKKLDVLTALEAQNRLEIACSDLNRVYSLQILFIVVFRFLSFISSSYEVLMCVIDFIKDDTNIINFLELLLEISWLLYAILDLYWLASNCTSVTKAAQKMNKSLYRLILYRREEDLLYCVKLRLHFVYNRKVEFTACGIFPIDFSLVHSVLASTFTLLVIMMQMS